VNKKARKLRQTRKQLNKRNRCKNRQAALASLRVGLPDDPTEEHWSAILAAMKPMPKLDPAMHARRMLAKILLHGSSYGTSVDALLTQADYGVLATSEVSSADVIDWITRIL